MREKQIVFQLTAQSIYVNLSIYFLFSEYIAILNPSVNNKWFCSPAMPTTPSNGGHCRAMLEVDKSKNRIALSWLAIIDRFNSLYLILQLALYNQNFSRHKLKKLIIK